ncbi:MAG: sugar phosphate isomerase/epimerase, partial [Thermotogae bacterium]|nr:sugar phosphate isomerase/epimerase [Thermotogota bacterium]
CTSSSFPFSNAPFQNEYYHLSSFRGAPQIYVAGWKIFGTSQKDAWNYSLDSLVQIAEYAKTKGITICVEPTSADSNVVETADDALIMMEESGLPNVSVMFDTFHVLYRNEDPTDYVYTMKENLKHIHISDYNRLPPGKGGMDFLPLMQALKDVGYNGYITMEVGFNARSAHPDSIARQALEHLKQIESQLE